MRKEGRKDVCQNHAGSDRKWPLLLSFLSGRTWRVTGSASTTQCLAFGTRSYIINSSKLTKKMSQGADFEALCFV